MSPGEHWLSSGCFVGFLKCPFYFSLNLVFTLLSSVLVSAPFASYTPCGGSVRMRDWLSNEMKKVRWEERSVVKTPRTFYCIFIFPALFSNLALAQFSYFISSICSVGKDGGTVLSYNCLIKVRHCRSVYNPFAFVLYSRVSEAQGTAIGNCCVSNTASAEPQEPDIPDGSRN